MLEGSVLQIKISALVLFSCNSLSFCLSLTTSVWVAEVFGISI